MSKTENLDKENLNESLKRLEAIAEWFDEQAEIDVEEGIKKVREAAEIIKTSRKRIADIENEFEELKEEIKEDMSEEE